MPKIITHSYQLVKSISNLTFVGIIMIPLIVKHAISFLSHGYVHTRLIKDFNNSIVAKKLNNPLRDIFH